MNRILVLSFAALLTCANHCGAADRTYSLGEITEISAEISKRSQLCGPLALFRVLARHGVEVSLDEVVREFSSDLQAGVTIQSIINVATRYGFSATAVAYSGADISDVPPGSILIVDKDSHCVVFEGFETNTRRAILWDPARAGTTDVTTGTLAARWSGVAIHVGKSNSLSLYDVFLSFSAGMLLLLLLYILGYRLFISSWPILPKVIDLH